MPGVDGRLSIVASNNLALVLAERGAYRPALEQVDEAIGKADQLPALQALLIQTPRLDRRPRRPPDRGAPRVPPLGRGLRARRHAAGGVLHGVRRRDGRPAPAPGGVRRPRARGRGVRPRGRAAARHRGPAPSGADLAARRRSRTCRRARRRGRRRGPAAAARSLAGPGGPHRGRVAAAVGPGRHGASSSSRAGLRAASSGPGTCTAPSRPTWSRVGWRSTSTGTATPCRRCRRRTAWRASGQVLVRLRGRVAAALAARVEGRPSGCPRALPHGSARPRAPPLEPAHDRAARPGLRSRRRARRDRSGRRTWTGARRRAPSPGWNAPGRRRCSSGPPRRRFP